MTADLRAEAAKAVVDRLPSPDRLASMIQSADASLRDFTGRNRSRTSFYWRDMGKALHVLLRNYPPLYATHQPDAPAHPHDGYAYDGCKCICCLNVRALALATPPVPAGTTQTPLGKLLKREIDQQEYVRQVNVQRELNGLPPMRKLAEEIDPVSTEATTKPATRK